MNKVNLFGAGLIVVFILSIFLVSNYGSPSKVDISLAYPFVFLGWDTQTPRDIHNQPVVVYDYPKELKIQEITSKKAIYEPYEYANITISIKNTLNAPYEIKVDWLFEKERKYGWRNISTNYYNYSYPNNTIYSWYNVSDKGLWKVQVVVSSINGSLEDEIVKEFEVI